MKNINRFVVIPICVIVMSVVICVSVLPLVWTLLSSFKTDLEIFASPIAFPEKLSFGSYGYVFKSAPVFTFLFNSLIVCFGGVFLNIFVVGMAAYVVARREFKTKNLFVMLVAMTMFVPAICAQFPVYMMYNKVGLINTKLGLILLFAGSAVSLTFFILRGNFMSIPRDIEDAAYIDGAGFFRTYIQIMMPMVVPGIMVAGVMLFINLWNNFLTPLIFTHSQNARTLSVMLNYFMSTFATNYSAMFAAIIITVIPNVIIYLIFSDKIVGGLTDGSVKG